ncbi:MAG TPA: MFS transporter, partial [Ktedonobacterales bacterium]|nr:MFS transporter [Ktedonobacterales bacterium]
ISTLGSHVTGTALPFAAIITLAATPAQVGLLAALGTLPVLLVGLLAGVLVDRLRRRPVLIATDLGRAALLATVPLAAVLHLLRIELLYVVALLVGLLTVFSGIAGEAFLPAVVGRAQLVEGNSQLGASDALAEIGGPPLGGVLVQWLTAPIAILFDAVSFLFSAACIALIRTPEQPSKPAARRPGVAREIIAGLRAVLANPLVRPLVAASATFNFFGNFIGTLYALYAIRELRFAPAVVGALVGLGGIGALAGALLVGPIVRRIGLGPAIISGLAVSGGFSLLIPLAGGPLPLALGMLGVSQLVGDVWIAIYLIGEASVRQAAIPDAMLGRATASMQVLMQGLAPVGAVLAGILGSIIGVRPTIFIGVGGILAAVLWLLVSPIRTLRQAPIAPGGAQETG